MVDFLEKTLLLGLGAALWTKEKIEKTIKELEEKGKLTQTEGRQLMEEMITKGKEERETIRGVIQEEIKKVLETVQIASKNDIKNLEAEINKLKEQVSKRA